MRDLHGLLHGASIYTLVPGYGPYHFLAGTFQHELSGGPFWHAVQATVSAGVLEDIFPSLHTACPTYFALFSFRYRKVAPFKYTWIVTTFCALQIIVATMFLRWHYLIDIVAGITLAIFAVTVSEALVVRDAARRERLVRDLGPDAVHANFDLLDFSWAKRALGMGRVQGDGEGEERARGERRDGLRRRRDEAVTAREDLDGQCRKSVPLDGTRTRRRAGG